MELTAEERAYFDSRGETAPPEEVAPAPAPAEPEPAPEQAPAAQDEQQGEPVGEEGQGEEERPRDDRGRFVPHQALHEERSRRKEAEEARRVAEDRFAKLLESLSQQQGQGHQQPQPEPEVDPDADPLAAVKAHHEELRQFKEWRRQQEQAAQAQQQWMSIAADIEASEAEFKQQAPDYTDAVAFLKTQAEATYRMMGMQPAQVQQALMRDVAQMAMVARQSGKSPAEFAYEFAKVRGYQPNPAAPKQDNAPAPEGMAAADKVRSIAEGQRAQRSIGQVAGGASPDLTADSVLAMSDDEFMAAIRDGRFRKVAGG